MTLADERHGAQTRDALVEVLQEISGWAAPLGHVEPGARCVIGAVRALDRRGMTRGGTPRSIGAKGMDHDKSATPALLDRRRLTAMSRGCERRSLDR